jgi:hypothetical protein
MKVERLLASIKKSFVWAKRNHFRAFNGGIQCRFFSGWIRGESVPSFPFDNRQIDVPPSSHASISQHYGCAMDPLNRRREYAYFGGQGPRHLATAYFPHIHSIDAVLFDHFPQLFSPVFAVLSIPSRAA